LVITHDLSKCKSYLVNLISNIGLTIDFIQCTWRSDSYIISHDVTDVAKAYTKL